MHSSREEVDGLTNAIVRRAMLHPARVPERCSDGDDSTSASSLTFGILLLKQKEVKNERGARDCMKREVEREWYPNKVGSL